MAIQDNLLDLIHAFHEAALEPDLWRHALARLGEAVGGSGVVVMSAYDPSGGAQLIESVGYDIEYWDRVQTEHSTPETNRYMSFINSASPGQVLQPRAMMSLKDWLEDPIYRKFLRPDGLVDGLMCPLVRKSGGFAAIATFRGRHYTSEHLKFLEAAAPHVRHALDVHVRLNSQTQLAEASRLSLDHLRAAVVLTDRHGRMISANQAALDILGRSDGISLGRGGSLQAWKGEDTTKLRALIMKASGYAERGVKGKIEANVSQLAGGSIRLLRPSGLSSVEVLVTSLRSPDTYGINVVGNRPSAIIFLSDPSEAADVDVLALRQMYGLTAAESRLVVQLILGVDIRAAAEAIGVSVHTARTLLKRSFERTETNRQVNLISKVLRSPLSHIARSNFKHRDDVAGDETGHHSRLSSSVE
jgi:PAS domain-containing protein/DNA-binding CsgD family transcriptional regulator